MNDDEFDAAVFRSGSLINILGRFEAAFGKSLYADRGDSEAREIFEGGISTTVTETKVVFSGATPVAMSFEE